MIEQGASIPIERVLAKMQAIIGQQALQIAALQARVEELEEERARAAGREPEAGDTPAASAQGD